MHSRHYLQADDFAIDRGAPESGTSRVFADWSPSRRVAIVAPDPAADLFRLAGVVLALTHRFYDRPEARSEGFFDYPSHYVIGGEAGAEPRVVGPTHEAPWSAAWCRIDVWPSSRHLVAHPDVATLLAAALMVEPTLLLWPSRLPRARDVELSVGPGDGVVRRLLRARLGAVWLYGSDLPDVAGSWRLSWGGGAAQLTREAADRLPEPGGRFAHAEWFVSTPVDAFLGFG